jgi:hypothetical protein
MELLSIDTDTHTQCVQYCAEVTANPPLPRPDLPDQDPLNTGRFVINTSQTPLAERIDALCVSIREQVPHLIPIPADYTYPHSFSTLWYTGERTWGLHKHIDPGGPNGERHLRILWMLSKPESGGDICVYNQMIPVKPSESWAIWADSQPHWSTPVTKPGIRTVITMGYWVLPEHVAEVKSALLPRLHHTTPGL